MCIYELGRSVNDAPFELEVESLCLIVPSCIESGKAPCIKARYSLYIDLLLIMSRIAFQLGWLVLTIIGPEVSTSSRWTKPWDNFSFARKGNCLPILSTSHCCSLLPPCIFRHVVSVQRGGLYTTWTWWSISWMISGSSRGVNLITFAEGCETGLDERSQGSECEVQAYSSIMQCFYMPL